MFKRFLCAILALMLMLSAGVACAAGTDEAALEVGMDLTGGLGSLGTALDGPCAAFVRAGSQEGDQTQQCIAGPSAFPLW